MMLSLNTLTGNGLICVLPALDSSRRFTAGFWYIEHKRATEEFVPWLRH